jgi:hypothetical protein
LPRRSTPIIAVTSAVILGAILVEDASPDPADNPVLGPDRRNRLHLKAVTENFKTLSTGFKIPSGEK